MTYLWLRPTGPLFFMEVKPWLAISRRSPTHLFHIDRHTGFNLFYYKFAGFFPRFLICCKWWCWFLSTTRYVCFWPQTFLSTLFSYIILGFWKVRFCLCFWSDFRMASICFKFSRFSFEVWGNGISTLVRAAKGKMCKFIMVTLTGDGFRNSKVSTTMLFNYFWRHKIERHEKSDNCI
jgi:hypothetical protein